MEEDERGRVRRFGFRVTAEATIVVEATQARGARDALGGLLDGATARVTSGVGAGLDLVDLRVSEDVALVSVDGVDPVEPLRKALSDWLTRDVGDG